MGAPKNKKFFEGRSKQHKDNRNGKATKIKDFIKPEFDEPTNQRFVDF
ncbi:MAG TPA: hypothetical protein VJ461_01730 [Candidatus Nanoarchaeia archaeon]|nr:hypothetical protein [Candidatus Nanoarchaeia archaeon]